MAAELATARGDAYDAALAPGRAVDVFFEDGTSDAGTIDRRVDGEYDVRYADDEVERLDRSHVADDVERVLGQADGHRDL